MFKWHVCLKIFAVLLFSVGDCLPPEKDTLNVGTVLFEEADTCRKTWTRDSISLLNSRRLMQDLLPSKVVDTSCDKYISIFINYVHSALKHIRNGAEGRSQQLMLYALGDTVGGYLRTYLLPVTKEAYYSGNLKYNETRRLYAMYEDIKILLKTNGDGWTKPKEVSHKHGKLPSLKISTINLTNACDDFIMQEGTTCGKVNIPIPYLDDKCAPHSIALPIKTEGRNLLSLHAPSSAYVVQKYYVGAVKCLLTSNATEKEILEFSSKVEKWLRTSICPHLEEETWYPAFGGTYRILTTIRRLEMRNQVPHKVHKRENSPESDLTTTSSKLRQEQDYSANGGNPAAPGLQILDPALPPGLLYPSGYPDVSSGPIDTGFTSRFNPFVGSGVVGIPEASHNEDRISKGNHHLRILEGNHNSRISEDFHDEVPQINAPELNIAGRYSGNVVDDIAGGVPEVVFKDEDEPYGAGVNSNGGVVEAGGDEEDDDDDDDDEEEEKFGTTNCNQPAGKGDTTLAADQVKSVNKNAEGISNKDSPESEQECCSTEKHVEASNCFLNDILDSLPMLISALVISPDLTFINVVLSGLIWLMIALIFMVMNHGTANIFLSEEEATGRLLIDYVGEKKQKEQDRRYRIHLKSCPNEKRKKIYSDVREGGPAFTKYFHTYFSFLCPCAKKIGVDVEHGLKEDSALGLPPIRPPSDRVISISRTSTTQSEYTLEMEDDEDEDDDLSSEQNRIIRRQSSSGESFEARDAHGNRLDSIYDADEPEEDKEEDEDVDEEEDEGEDEEGEDVEFENDGEDEDNEELSNTQGKDTGGPKYVRR